MASHQDSYSCQLLRWKKGKLADSPAIERSKNDVDGEDFEDEEETVG